MMYEVTSNTLLVRVNAAGQVTSLQHRASGYEFLSAGAPPAGLWQMGLIRPVCYDDPLPLLEIAEIDYAGHEYWKNRDEYRADLLLDSDAAPAPEINGDAAGLTLVWSVPVPGGAAAVVLRVLGGERDGLEFRCSVSLPEGWALKRVTYPRIRGFGDAAAPGDDALLYPENWGVLRKNPLDDMTAYTGQYPSASNWCQMTAWLHGTAGLYLGVRDPDTNHTGIDVQYVEGTAPAPWNIERWQLPGGDVPPKPVYRPLAERLAEDAQPGMQIRCNHWPEMRAEWQCPYPVLLQGFTGSWYDAAQIHRAWATQQRWCRRGRLSERADASRALLGLDLWFIRYGFHAGSFEPKPAWEFRDAMLKLREYFGMPFGVHWYHWHNFSWHSTYPTHSPVAEGFEEVKNELQARGIVIMPYCQGRLLYRNRPTLEADRAHASVEANGQPYLEMYTPQDDWPLALCPGDAWSQMQWHEAARMLWRQYGTEGVYFDQITAMIPSLCYHAGHGHPLGGGQFYWKGYDQALGSMAPMIAENPDRFLSSELMADAFLDRIDLYLSFVPPLEDYVPLHAAIYAGYTVVMGRSTPENVMADRQLMAICHGEQLLFGGQVGWMNEAILKYPDAAVFLRDIARLRAHIRDFFLGTLEPELPIEQQAILDLTLPSSVTGKPFPIRLQRGAVRGTTWRAPDGRRLLLFLNETPEETTIRIQLPSDWPASAWQVWRQGCETSETITPEQTIELTIPGLSAAAVAEE